MTRWPVATLILLAAGFPGCASYRAKPLDPSVELAAEAGRAQELVRVQVPSAHGALPVVLDDGLDEVETVAVGLALNPALQQQRLAIGVADAALITAGLWPNPTVGVGVRDGRTGILVDADLLFALLRPGERSAKRGAAQAQQQATTAGIVAAEWEAVADIRRFRLAVCAAALVASTAGEETDLRTHALGLVRRQRELGEARDLDVATASWELGEAKHEQRQSEAELSLAKRDLNRLLGLPPEYEAHLTGLGEALAVQPMELPPIETLDAQVSASRWDLKHLQAEYEQSEQELRLAIAKQYPQLSIGPALSHDKDATSIGIGASIELPVFDRNQGGIHAADTKREQARAAYRVALHDLLSQAHAARDRAARAAAEVEAYRTDILPNAERVNAMMEQALTSRDVSVLDYLAQRRRWIQTRIGYLRAAAAFQRAWIDLDAALGRSPLESALNDTTAPEGPHP